MLKTKLNNLKNETNGEKKEEGEILDFNKPDFKFIPKGSHLWRQQGPYLICKSCELSHAVWIGMDKQLIGFDKESPIIQKVRN